MNTMEKFRKVKDGLFFKRQEARGESIFVVRDPISQKYFKVGEIEHFIIQNLDGINSPQNIQQKILEEYNINVTVTEIEEFIQKIEKLGLIEGIPVKLEKKRLEFRNPFYIKIRFLDPDVVVTNLEKSLRFLFTPAFIVPSWIIIIAGVVITAIYFPQLINQLSVLWSPITIPIVWILMFLVSVIHELSHGIACKHFGGEVAGIGILLISFMPSLYCDISSIRLFEKRQSILTLLAGIYSNLLLWGISAITWLLTPSKTSVNNICLPFIFMTGLGTITNLIPLIRLDGYYILTIWLDMPNLKEKSFKYLVSIFKKIFSVSSKKREKIKKEERTFFIIYGVLGTIFSLFLGGAFLWWLISFFIYIIRPW